ncbi:arsinothricin resistance N-acetyltransferase ArsN1 family B [Cellvibrio sp. pealriver]|uniref:arsinothricin resistance N-acetyltransferase ArsN1 family B n=1 Tax=Cellvibrio sp. pealriver TaxID=1622269 RepID=UPI00066FB5EA|nr:arsinothricin resistance N-acetyltransferase ArsN1 family B [Cellvibrio sp. pealriver]
MIIRPCTINDITAICAIYNHYIENTVITFEETPVSIEQMRERIDAITQTFPWLVCEVQGEVIGYAYASKWKDRSAYRHTAEVTVYLHPDNTSKGIGTGLYTELIAQLKQQGMHMLLACIALPNTASENIHEKFGFAQAAHFPQVGFKFNHWIDIGYWQKAL